METNKLGLPRAEGHSENGALVGDLPAVIQCMCLKHGSVHKLNLELMVM